MAYTVLARKYRSRTFEEVIGQEPIATTLVNAIKAGRIHHGYLFTGTRGVGKTSMARILAKALNCQRYDAPTVTPCCQCDVCLAIAEGQDMDVLEIDAASNTGVDNIRELRSNTAYRPARARYKVYIIDEVHMLSTGAFNALLKTLEEPPEHVKFILATTEVQKVPATIQSRCQRFNFRHIEPEAIARRLLEIAHQEGTECEEAVAQRVARLAAGSMRDALSILDQLISVAPQRIDLRVLEELLPPPQDERLRKLLRHAAAGEVASVLLETDGILAAGQGLEVFCQDVIELLRTLLLVRVCGPDARLVDIPRAAREEYVALAGCFEVSHYVQMIAMFEELRRNVRYSAAGRALTEALLVRIAHMRQWGSIEQLLAGLPAANAADEKKKHPSPEACAVSRAATQPITPSGPELASAAPDAGRDVRLSSGCQGEYAGAAPAIKVPAGYRPPEAEGGAPRQTGELGQRAFTLDERRRAEADPVVRQTLALFDGILLDVRWPSPKATSGQRSEKCSETSANS